MAVGSVNDGASAFGGRKTSSDVAQLSARKSFFATNEAQSWLDRAMYQLLEAAFGALNLLT